MPPARNDTVLSALAFGALPARQRLRVDPYLALWRRATGPAAPSRLAWLPARRAADPDPVVALRRK